MKKLRSFWIVIVIAVAGIFVAYRLNEISKEDSSGPVFSCEKQVIEVSIQDGDDVLLQGITAQDKKDGDVTSSVLVENLSNLYDGNKRTATYAAFDSDNHITKMEREIIYTDYESPRFGLTGSLRFKAGETVNIDQIVTATDCLDGDLSRNVKIRMDGTINNRVIGSYDIEYQVTNSAGDSVTLPIEIEIYQSSSHEVEMSLKQYLVYYDGTDIDYKDYLKSIKIGNLEYPFVDVMLEGMESMDLTTPEDTEDTEGAVDTDTEDGEIDPDTETADSTEESSETENKLTFIPKNRVTVTSSVDTSTPGVYPVYFYYLDEQEYFNYEATEVMYVVVE